VSPLTVQAPPAGRPVLEKQIREFVDSHAAPTAKLDQFARWYIPVCVAVTGVVPGQAAPIKAQVEQVATAVGERVAPSGCKPNIEIVFSAASQRDLDAIAARNPAVLGPGGAKTVTRPIQAWYAVETLGQPAGPRGPIGAPPPPAGPFALLNRDGDERSRGNQGALAARRCIDLSSPSCPHSGFQNVLVMVDPGRIGDVGVSVTSDYIAMLALSQPRSLDGCMALPSVTDLFAGDCPGRDPPSGLTSADMAYLTSLYAADLTVAKSSEQSDIANRMVKILAANTGPTR
jgi:hypothetical protein